MNVLRCWLLLVATTTLGACSVVPQSPPHDIYRLPPSSLGTGGGEPLDLSLRINRPAASDLLDSTRIVVVPEGHRLSAYQGARWSAPAPVLWRDHLLDAFHNDGRIARLSGAAERVWADVELGGTLRAFQTEYHAGGPEVVIQFDAQLVDSTGKRIIASRRFVAREAVQGAQLPAVVDAFGRASDGLARELIDWTLRHSSGRTGLAP